MTDITPKEMFRRLHWSGYGVKRAVYAVFSTLQPGLDVLCAAAVSEYRQPLVEKETLEKALRDCGFSADEVKKAIAEQYPADTNRYAAIFSGDAFGMNAGFQTAYNVGTGDFTVEAWVKPCQGGGTILSRKSTEGGAYHGGFLLVLKPDGTVKLAADDGIGFYEINTVPQALYDGSYHHILGLRRGSALEIYVDFVKADARVRTNRFPGLNTDSALGITVGAAKQRQEPYNGFHGAIGECRVWKKAVTYSSRAAWEATDYIESGLLAIWGFWNQTGKDYSALENDMDVSSVRFERWGD